MFPRLFYFGMSICISESIAGGIHGAIFTVDTMLPSASLQKTVALPALNLSGEKIRYWYLQVVLIVALNAFE